MFLRLQKKWYAHRGYTYDHSKHMWYRYKSDCCGAETSQSANKYPVKDKALKGLAAHRDYCTKCHNECALDWRFVHHR